jgi:hypothetical protein
MRCEVLLVVSFVFGAADARFLFCPPRVEATVFPGFFPERALRD